MKAFIIVLPFSSLRVSDSSFMIAWLKATKASIFVIFISCSVILTSVPEDLVMTSGSLRRPKTPPGPAMSSLEGWTSVIFVLESVGGHG